MSPLLNLVIFYHHSNSAIQTKGTPFQIIIVCENSQLQLEQAAPGNVPGNSLCSFLSVYPRSASCTFYISSRRFHSNPRSDMQKLQVNDPSASDNE